MKQNKWGFTSQQVPSLGTHVVLTLTEALWFLDPLWERLKSIGINVPKPLSIWSIQFNKGYSRYNTLDSDYCRHQFLLLKSFAVKWKDLSIFQSLDDKAIILVGNPDQTVSTGVRSQHGWIVCNDKIVALVHDFHVAGIVSSVCYNVSIPESIHNSFYRGSVHVTVKDNIFEPSSPLRLLIFNLVTARAFITCSKCGKRRVVYCAARLYPAEMRSIWRVEEELIHLWWSTLSCRKVS